MVEAVTRALAMAAAKVTMWVMVTATRLAGNKGARARAARAMVMAMRVVGNKEGEGSKVMVTGTRVTGK